MSDDPEALEDVVHEIHSKASSLREGAGLLRKATPGDRDKLLEAMARHADKLARFLDEHREGGGRP